MARPVARRGHSPAASRAGFGSFAFFGAIVVAVAAAGILGVVLWGPEKTVKNRTQFATNPPAPTTELPSLAASAEPPSSAAPVGVAPPAAPEGPNAPAVPP